MLSKFEYDGDLNPNFRVGEFALPLASIYGVNSSNGKENAAKIVHVSSAGVTRVNRPGIDLEKVKIILCYPQLIKAQIIVHSKAVLAFASASSCRRYKS